MPARKKTATRVDLLTAQLAEVAAAGGAGKEQADRALGRSPKAKKTAGRKKAKRGSGPMGKPISCYMHEAEQAKINTLLDKLGAASGANKSHLLRAGIHALAKLSKAELAALVETIQATDGRRK